MTDIDEQALPLTEYQFAQLPSDDLEQLRQDYQIYQKSEDRPEAQSSDVPAPSVYTERDCLITESSPHLAWCTTPTGKVTFCNRRWMDYTGQTQEQARGLGWIRAVHPADLIYLARRLKMSDNGEGRYEAEYRLRRAADGKYRWHLARAILLKNEQGVAVGWFGSASDIDERKRSEEANQRLSAIVESSDDAIIGKDLSGIITSWNRAAETIYGYTEAEALGKPVSLLIPEERRKEDNQFLSAIQAGRRMEHYETVRQRKDGQRVHVAVTISPIYDRVGKIIGASTIARNITERKRLEAERERLIGELQAALTEVKALTGLLPICASCKKIRDDQGEWTVLEKYVTEHSTAKFTHGLCPQCVPKYFGELH